MKGTHTSRQPALSGPFARELLLSQSLSLARPGCSRSAMDVNIPVFLSHVSGRLSQKELHFKNRTKARLGQRAEQLECSPHPSACPPAFQAVAVRRSVFPAPVPLALPVLRRLPALLRASGRAPAAPWAQPSPPGCPAAPSSLNTEPPPPHLSPGAALLAIHQPRPRCLHGGAVNHALSSSHI